MATAAIYGLLASSSFVVGVRQAGHQPRLDPTAVGNDQGGSTVRHGLHDARPATPMGLGDRGQTAAAAEQLSIGPIGVRPVPLLVMVDHGRHIP